MHSGESSSEDEVEYPDEDEQGLPEPDIKEYILRCVVRCSGDNGPPRKSTVHRLYAMVERKAAHLRLACAVSESEGPTPWVCDNLKQHLSKCVKTTTLSKTTGQNWQKARGSGPRSVRIARPRRNPADRAFARG